NPNYPTIKSIASTGLKRITIEIQFPAIGEIKCNYNGTNGYVDLIKVKLKKTNTENTYQTKIIYILGQIKRIQYFDVTDNELLPYTEYDVIVILANRNEESDSSGKAVVRMVEDVPSQPRNVTLDPAVFFITVQWLIPEPANGKITGYQITNWIYNNPSTLKSLEITDDLLDVMKYQITDLEYDVRYSVKVKASTSVGYGIASSEVSITTAET
uniref:Tyrosine-protein phosphatase Lar-like n=1 Tax=Saccoglossus kowalevskii TaxID=10224 RepID=A0ABM0MR97_SACKO